MISYIGLSIGLGLVEWAAVDIALMNKGPQSERVRIRGPISLTAHYVEKAVDNYFWKKLTEVKKQG